MTMNGRAGHETGGGGTPLTTQSGSAITTMRSEMTEAHPIIAEVALAQIVVVIEELEGLHRLSTASLVRSIQPLIAPTATT